MNRIALILFLIIATGAHAQKSIPILERKITLQLFQEKVPYVLDQIARAGGFSFSYNNSIISPEERVTVNASESSVREVLAGIFGQTMEYREKGNHLILRKAETKDSPPPYIMFTGYVQDAITGKRIPDASVYDKKSISSVITDEYGFFRLKLDKKNEPIVVQVNKIHYRDTAVTLGNALTQHLIIGIHHLPDTLTRKELAPDTLQKESLEMPYEEDVNVQNIDQPIYRDIQISFLPFLGSNGSLSGNVINNYSINMLGGYSRGTRQIELGFIVNMDREDVSWMQVAGIGNLVGGNVYGLQASGFFNVNGGETKAAQLTGFGNVNFDDVQGVQVAGAANTNLASTQGVQIAGIGNFNRFSSKGVQVAGVANVQIGDYTGSQFSAISNFTSQRISGSQIAAVFNYGRKVHGTQIGLVNYADSLGGVPVGLISFVNKGYHKLELSADEIFYTNMAFRTGVRQFYNIILAGYKPESSSSAEPVWTVGYGIGTAPRLTKWLHFNFDLTAQHVDQGTYTSQLSLLNKLHIGLDFRVARKLSLYGGVTLNGYLTKTGYPDYPVLFTNNQPNIFFEQTYSNGNNLKMWWGLKAGIRLL